ncbi:MAG: hypothetical protein HKN26_02165 [Acidimicrobiales bacterium]|nr:hypothetical protein [Acidimicrobiales bacterium]
MRPVRFAPRSADRSAVMVEFVIAAPLLVLLVFGLLEFGLAWRDSQTVATAARSGARVGSNLGANPEADYNVLLSILAASEAVGVENINYVVIYNAADLDGEIPASCQNATGFIPSAGNCNVYTTADLLALSPSDFLLNVADDDCKNDSLHRFWCPLSRTSVSQYDLKHFGVHVEITHEATSGVFPIANLEISDTAVMRIEPAGAS